MAPLPPPRQLVPAAGSRFKRRLATLALPAVLGACTGSINGTGDETRPGTPVGPKVPSGTGGKAGTGGTPTPPGDSGNPDPGGGDGPPESPVAAGIGWSTRLPRLTHAQWENTTRDLLRLDAASGLSSSFTPDPFTRFDTEVAGRKVSAALWNDYQNAAEKLAAFVAKDPTRLAKLVPQNLPATGPERGKSFVRAFGRRAFRRPLTDGEVTTYAALFDKGGTMLGGDPLASGVELVLRAMLQSPHFIYRVEETSKVESGRTWLSGFEVATRLSYALWNTMPSDELLAAVEAGELNTDQGRKGWVDRLVGDTRAASTLRAFHQQLFETESFGSSTKDEKRFPGFDATIGAVLRDEGRLFIDEIVTKEQGGLAALLTSPVVFANERTAPIYGVTRKLGAGFERIELDPQRRAGLLTQIGFLSKHGGLVQSDPIHRGIAVNTELLCVDLAPAPDVPPLPPEEEGVTNRERVAKHTDACGGACHKSIINPIGFAFENYDTVGAWRDQDNKVNVDATGSYDWQGVKLSFSNAVELSKKLSQEPKVHDCYARHWFAYAFGRTAADNEASAVSALAQASAGGASAKDLLSRAVLLDAFRSRPEEPQGGTP